MANELTILFDCRVHVFAYVDYDVMPATPTGTDLIPLGWSDIPEQQLSATKMNVWSYSDYDFVNNCSLGNWSEPIVITGIPDSGALDYGFNFGYSDDANTPPSVWGKILAIPTGDYMWMEKYRIINSEAIRTLDFILINNESEQYTNYFKNDVIHEYNYVSESMNTRVIGDAKVYKNTADADDYYTGREYVIYNNEKYYLDVKSISKSYNKDAAKYTYSLTFNNEYNKLFTTPFKNIATINEEPQFYTNSNVVNFVGNIGELKDRINACLTKSYSSYMYQVSYDSGFSPILTNYQQVNAENINIFDALKMFYDVFSVPFYIEGYNIILGREPNDIGHTFEYGNGIKEMTKGKSKDFVTTSVSGKGSQTNIPFRYPLIKDEDGNVINHPYTSTYLMPTCYTESVRRKVQFDAVDYDPNILIVNSYEAVTNDSYVNEAGATVDVVYENPINANNYAHEFVDFEEIQPTITGVTYSGQRIDKIKSVSYQEGDAQLRRNDDINYFFIELNPMGFDLYAHAIETGEMTLSMNSGACGGCQFKVLGSFSQVFSAYDVYFAKQNSGGSYSANDFLLFYDRPLFRDMSEAINFMQNYSNVYETVIINETPRVMPSDVILDSALIATTIKNTLINGLNVHTLLKQKIDILMTYESIYVDIVSENFSDDVAVGNNFTNTAKEQIYLLYNNWSTYTNAQFASKCWDVYKAIKEAETERQAVKVYLMKDYSNRVYPPSPPYYTGDFFVTKVRNLTDYPDSTSASITLKVLKDDSTFGTILPNQFVKPKANDTFVILNIDMPDAYVVAAQRRLDKALKEYLQTKNKDNANYTIELSQAFLGDNLTIYNKIKHDTYMNFKFKGTTVSQQIKRITKKYKTNFPEVLVEFYADEEKKKSIGNRIITLQQAVIQTQRTVTNNNNTNRRLLTTTTNEITRLDERQTTTIGLVESKNKMFIDTPQPPYRQGDTWNNNGVLRRCNNGKTENQSFDDLDWDNAVKITQFMATYTTQDYQAMSTSDWQQTNENMFVKFLYAQNADLVLHNPNEYQTENILYLINTSTTSDIDITFDFSEITLFATDKLSVFISVGYMVAVTLSYTNDNELILTTKENIVQA